MPEQRLTRTRATLPEGYQFGDAHLALLPMNDRNYRIAFALNADDYGYYRVMDVDGTLRIRRIGA